MSDDEYAHIAQELQAQPYPKGPPRTPPPWAVLTESSKAYGIAKARAGERPRPPAEPATTPVVQVPRRG